MKLTKREAILNAALVLFVQRGFEGTIVPEIAKRANVGAGTIYRYFDSKETLLNILFQEHLTRFEAILYRDIFREGISVRKQFHQLFQNIISFANKDLNAMLFIDMQSYSHNLNEESQKRIKNFFESLSTVLEKGKSEGMIVDLPSRVLISIVYGSILHLYKNIRHGDLQESEEMLERVEQCCWNAICAHNQRI